METREVHAFVCVASVECLNLDQQDWKFDSDVVLGHQRVSDLTDDEFVDGSDTIEVEGDMRQAQKILEHDGSYVLTRQELVDNDYSIADVADLANSAAALTTVVVLAVVVAVLVVDNDWDT